MTYNEQKAVLERFRGQTTDTDSERGRLKKQLEDLDRERIHLKNELGRELELRKELIEKHNVTFTGESGDRRRSSC